MKFLYTICVATFFAGCLFAPTAEAQESDPVMLFFKNGEKYRSQERYKEAIGEYDHALAISDTSALINYWKGFSYMMLKDADNAAAALERAVAIDASYLKAYQGLVKVYTASGNTERLVNTFNRISEIVPGQQKKEYKLKGLQILIRGEKYVAAKELADQVLKIDPNDLEALHAKGMTNNHLGHFEVAQKTMETAISKLKAKDQRTIAKYYYELGLANHKLGNYEKADEAFVKADFGPYRALIAKLRPGYYYNVATSYNMVYEYEIAIDMLKTSLKIDKSYASANMMLAEIAIKEEHHHKGIQYYKEALKEAGDDVDNTHEKIYNKLIETLLNAKKFNEAIATADECLTKFPGARNVRFMKSIALHRHDKADEGITILEALLGDGSITPIETLMYNFGLGIMYASVKDFDKAKAAFAKARRGPFANAAQYAYESMSDEIAIAEEKGEKKETNEEKGSEN